MNKSTQFWLGINTYSKAFRFIFEHKMAKAFLFPILFMVLLFIGGQAAINGWIDTLKATTLELIRLDSADFWGAGFLASVVQFSVHLLTEIMFFVAVWYIGGYVLIMVLSPVLGYVSEKTENIITGNQYEANFAQILKDVIRGITIALRNMAIEMGVLILTFLVGLIPVIGWFAAIFMFVISAYFYGFSFLDLNNERRRLSIRQSVKMVRKYKWLAIGNGMVFSLSLLIPFCGMFISAFVAIISAVAASLAMNDSRIDWELN